MSPHVFGLLAVALLGQRLAECRQSSWRLRELGPPSAGRPRPERSLLALHAASLVLPWVEVELRAHPLDPRLFLACAATLAAAQLLRAATQRSLGPYWTQLPAVFRGQRLVRGGPYARVMHPNYLAVAIELVALPLAGAAWGSLIVLNLLHAPILARRIRLEERALATLDGFGAYARTRGRLLPRLLRRDSPCASTPSTLTSTSDA